MKRVLRVGSRTSPLALVQVQEILNALKRIASTTRIKIVGIDTVGDRDKKTPISEMEGTDFFTREIDEALLRHKIDFAVHSAKDMPDILPKGIVVAAVTASVDPYDVLVSRKGLKLRDLPKGARVGTSSERRKAQIRAYRPDLTIVDIRGTMQERLDKLKSEGLEAIVIAGAGLLRLGLGHHITEQISLDILRPHPLQGSLAVTVRREEEALKKLFSKLDKKKIASYETQTLSGAPEKNASLRAKRSNLRDRHAPLELAMTVSLGSLRKSVPRKRILVTGTSVERFESLGEIIYAPMIEIKPVKDPRFIDAAIKRLAHYDGIVFTSRHGVQYFLERLEKKMKNVAAAKGKEIIAIGKTTARRLAGFGLPATRVAREESADGIVRMLKRFSWGGRRFLIPRSELSNDRMVEALRKAGALVDTVTVYRNVPVKAEKKDLSKIDEVVFTSPSTVKNFLKIYRKIPGHIKVKAIGPVTRACLKAHGIPATIVSQGSK